jgi:hypothetical protein
MAKTALIVTHHLFLTREQRYALQTSNSPIDLVGISSPIWVNNGKWESDVNHEVFCKYQIVHSDKPDKQTVRITSDGYIITLTGTMNSNLKDIEDDGSTCLMLTHRNIVIAEGQQLPVLHCVEIEDMSHCEKTLY